MLRLLLFLLALSASFPLFSQQISEHIFGGPEWETLHGVFETPEGRINVVGARNVGTNEVRTQFFQLDTNGTILLTKDLGPLAASLHVFPDPDGTFQLARYGAAGYTFTRFDASGTALDSFVYSHPDFVDDYFFALRQTPDGGFVLAFEDYNPPTGVRLVRLGPGGNVVFNKFVASDDPELNENCLAVLPNGRTVLVVLDYSQGYRVICYGPTGATLWTKGVPYIPTFAEFGLLPLPNSHLVFYGPSGGVGSTYVDGFAACYDLNGNFVWNRTFENVFPPTSFSVYRAAADGDFTVLAGDYSSPGLGAGLVKLDASGNIVFAEKLPLMDSGSGRLLLDANGDYLLTGYLWHQTGIGSFQAEEAYALSLQPDGTQNWFVQGQANWVNAVRSVAQTANGDLWLGGNHRPSGSAGPFDHYLLRMSGLGPVLARQVHGQLRRDSLDNCAPDAGEPGLGSWTVRAQNSQMTRYTVTDDEGRFALRLNGDGGALTVLPPNDLWGLCEASYPFNFNNSDTAQVAPQVRLLLPCPLLHLDGSAAFLRRCFDNTYSFYWQNEGTAPAQDVLLVVELDTFMTYVSASLPLAAQNGALLSFELGDLPPGAWGQLHLTVNISCQAPLGQLHCLLAGLQSPAVCLDHDGHTAALRDCQPNIGSYDPNDKRAFVGDVPFEGDIMPDAGIKYQIRFQNTGTDTAFNVVITDTLSAYLDPTTVQPGAASHSYVFYRFGENGIKFAFNNIRLVDSFTNEPASHGFVNLTVKPKPNLPDGTILENSASIFFDFNDPIRTNTHTLTIDRSLSVWPDPPPVIVRLYPNPSADGRVWVECPAPIERVEVFDARGRLLGTAQGGGERVEVALPPAPGMYALRVWRAGLAPAWVRGMRER